ncbi:HET-domain-containing protein [Stipitochalara longipes BDJ]|nr:HET-domain-containing protein [Stipitochalara longipes BDJ]
MEVDDLYQYSELTETDAIRLIYLYPSENLEAGIECSLHNATLSEFRDNIREYYTALSYVWGDQNDTRSIRVDGKRLEITASLRSALHYVRDNRRVIRIWADGVCINQKDIYDRNRQVRLMGNIYSTALHTVIFLGLSSPQSDLALQMIIHEDSFAKQSKETSDRSSQKLPAGQFTTILEDEILSRPWFTRVWILQELVLSQTPWIQCGQYRIRWHSFCEAVMSSTSPSWKSDSRLLLSNMNQIRLKFRKGSKSEMRERFPGSSLLDILLDRRGCALSDPRDMIYAHLGLVSHALMSEIPINYDKPVVQVYEDLARSYLKWASLGMVLSVVETVQPEDRRVYLPSWVPDWTSRQLSAPIFPSKPWRDQTPNSRSWWVGGEVPGVLAVVGIQYDTVQAVVIPRSSWPEWDHQNGSIVDSVKQWMSRSDDEFLRARQILIDYSALVNSDIWGYPAKCDDPEWEEVATTMSAWAPTGKTVPKSLVLPFTRTVGTTPKKFFANVCINNLLAFMECYGASKQVAILERSILALLPMLAQPGDLMIRLLQLEDNIYAIIRPCKDVVTPAETEQILTGLEFPSDNKGLASSPSCKFKFVTLASDISRGLSEARGIPRESNLEMMFVLR